MIDDRIVDLINRDIDGMTSHEEQVHLVSLRASRDDVEHMYQNMLGLHRALTPPEPVDPPATLQPAIMRTITARGMIAAQPSWFRKQISLTKEFISLPHSSGAVMANTIAQARKGRRNLLIAGGSILAIVCVVVFAIVSPPVASEDSTGTIGAVKQDDASSMTERDAVLQGENADPVMADPATIGSVTKVSEQAKELARITDGVRVVGKNAEGLKALADGARELAAQAEAVKALGRASEAAKYAEAAKELARQAEGMKSLGRVAEASRISESARALSKSAEGVSAAILANEARILADGARELARASEEMKSLGRMAESAKLAEAAKEFSRYAESARSIGRTAEAANLAGSVSELGAMAVGLKAEGMTELARTLEAGMKEAGRVAESAKAIGGIEEGARAVEDAKISDDAKAAEGARAAEGAKAVEGLRPN
jgi:hypothetical protein